MQNGQETAKEVCIHTSLSILSESVRSLCTTKDSNSPEPMAVLGLQVKSLAGNIFLPVSFSDSHIPIFKMKGIRAGGWIYPFIFNRVVVY